ncbi:MAG: hypothetical protein IJV38_10040 [Prevotella sp.]|nr:hypothetical protein [Prevotella sp.]
MALVSNPVLGVNLRKNQNSKSLAFGKYYAEVDRQKTLNIRGFAEHMISHGCVYDRGDIESILIKVTECLPELVAQGIPIQLGELGIFYPSIQAEGINNVTPGLDPRALVKAVHLRFLPNASKLGDLSGPAFKDRCTLELRNVIDEVVIDGEKYKKLVPIDTYVAEHQVTP